MTEEIINLRNLIQNKGDIFYCKVDKCDVVKRLKQENETINKVLLTERQENAELATENYNLRKALETIREILNVKCSIIANAECVGIINEVLNESV